MTTLLTNPMIKMKRIPILYAILLLLLIASETYGKTESSVAVESTINNQHVTSATRKLCLDREVEPLRHIAPDGPWDFSLCDDVSGSNDFVITAVHEKEGLVSERSRDYRQWWVVSNDTMRFAGDETVHRIFAPYVLPVTRTGSLRPGDTSVSSYRGSGKKWRTLNVVEEGNLSCGVVGRGTLITAPGDTLADAVLTREHRVFKERISSTMTMPDTAWVCSRTTYRWYATADDLLPCAVQTAVCRLDDGLNELDREEQAFVPGLGTKLPDNNKRKAASHDADRLADALKSFEASCSDGVVTVSVMLPDGQSVPLSVDIVDAPGNLYSHTESDCSGVATITVSVAGLSPRRYIVALTTPLLPSVVEKRYLEIK